MGTTSFIFSVVVVLLGVLISFIEAPRQGVSVGARHYLVSTDELQQTRERWTQFPGLPGEAVHEAAMALSSTFVPSVMDQTTRDFLQRSADATNQWTGKLAAYIKFKLLVLTQWMLGFSKVCLCDTCAREPQHVRTHTICE